jgi:hypothetical protein
MADYYTPTVVQQTIPDSDITPLERLLLSNIFTAEPDGAGFYFYAEEAPAEMIWLPRDKLAAALDASKGVESEANTYIAEQLSKAPSTDAEIELDLSMRSYGFLFQSIIRRSSKLQYVSVISSFACSRMRPDGFGGLATLITADSISAESTEDVLSKLMTEAGIDLD